MNEVMRDKGFSKVFGKYEIQVYLPWKKFLCGKRGFPVATICGLTIVLFFFPEVL